MCNIFDYLHILNSIMCKYAATVCNCNNCNDFDTMLYECLQYVVSIDDWFLFLYVMGC